MTAAAFLVGLVVGLLPTRPRVLALFVALVAASVATRLVSPRLGTFFATVILIYTGWELSAHLHESHGTSKEPSVGANGVDSAWMTTGRVERESATTADRAATLTAQLDPHQRPMLKLVRDDATLEVTASDAGYLVHHIKQLPHDREQVHQACTTDSHDGEIEAHAGDHTFWYPPALFVTKDQAIACAHQFATDGALAPDITWAAETRGHELVRVPWQQELA